MTEQEILNKVQSVMNGECTPIMAYKELSKVHSDDALEQYYLRTAIRLLIVRAQLRERTCSKVDFECCLRDFLLVYKASIIIPNYTPSDRATDFGLICDQVTGQVWVDYALPDIVNAEFVRRVCLQGYESPKIENRFALYTNAFIRKLTGFTSFRSEEQKLAVMGALRTPSGYTTLIAMSTGGGKSLVTQLTAYQQQTGLTIIVIPTISLMLDQQKNARAILKPQNPDEILCYYSGIDSGELCRKLKKKQVRMLFVSPEALVKNAILRQTLLELSKEQFLSNLIIDEAHIVIEWGSSFRTDYQCIDSLRKEIMENNPALRTFLLSATLSASATDLLKRFYSEDGKWMEIRCDKLRHELLYDVIQVSSLAAKRRQLTEMICKLPHPMIVYVQTPGEAEKLKTVMTDFGFKNIRSFTGKTSSNDRERLITEWSENKFSIMIATCAFGVGVDKPDVRTVLHTYIPENPNKYYQEAGRGGRDGLPALSTVLYHKEDLENAYYFTDKVMTPEKIQGRWFSMVNGGQSARLPGQRLRLDTSVKPSYHDDDEFIVFANDTDITWNVYVILLLRRRGALEIENSSYISRKTGSYYQFVVHVLSDELLFEKPETVSYIAGLREQEAKQNQNDFLAMKSALREVGRECWSEMFPEIYTRAEYYCAGCNQHNRPMVGGKIGLPIRKTLKMPAPVMTDSLKRFLMGAARILVIAGQKTIDLAAMLYRHGATSIIADNEQLSAICEQLEKGQGSDVAAFYEYAEAIQLIEKKYGYLEGVVVLIMPEEPQLAKRFVSLMHKPTIGIERRFIVLSSVDKTFSNGKMLSSMVEGPCKQGYIAEGELMNVY